jgi:putative two-component system response regulator
MVHGDPINQARILIIDDERANVRFLELLLKREGYSALHGITNPQEALERFLTVQPDLILLDLHMPHPNGFELLAHFQQLVHSADFLPILVLTADVTPGTKHRALDSGATDFLSKPLDSIEVLLRVKSLLHTRELHLQMRGLNLHLEETVYERTEALEAARHVILQRLALAAEFRDDDTGQHARRVGQLAALLAVLFDLPEAEVMALRRAAPLHDVGKIAIPDQILLKPGKLTPAEFTIMKTHTTIGAHILDATTIPLLELAQEIALTHHERWDGSGYPQGLAGEAIPLSGRIVGLVDVFDALTHVRPYKPAWSQADALAEIEAQSCRHFDPRVVRTFSSLFALGLQLDDVPAEASAPSQREAGGQRRLPPAPVDYERLTARELEVLKLIAQGCTNREIAQHLSVSIGTAKVHVEHIIAKLGANDRTQAAMRAMKFGLLDLAALEIDTCGT